MTARHVNHRNRSGVGVPDSTPAPSCINKTHMPLVSYVRGSLRGPADRPFGRVRHRVRITSTRQSAYLADLAGSEAVCKRSSPYVESTCALGGQVVHLARGIRSKLSSSRQARAIERSKSDKSSRVEATRPSLPRPLTTAAPCRHPCPQSLSCNPHLHVAHRASIIVDSCCSHNIAVLCNCTP